MDKVGFLGYVECLRVAISRVGVSRIAISWIAISWIAISWIAMMGERLSVRTRDACRRGAGVAAVLAVLWLAVVGWSHFSEPAQTNLLLVSLDTVRADHLSAYGYAADTSPFLRELSSEGARLSQAYSASATTGPSHATIFTSLYPLAHGVLKNGMNLGAGPATLAELLGREGYETVGVASSFVLDARFGYARGFDRWEDDFDPSTSTVKAETWTGFDVTSGFDRRANEATDRAVGWLETRSARSRPFFLFVHYFDAHGPYDPPEPYRSRFAGGALAENSHDYPETALYDGEIAFADDQVRRLLGALGSQGLTENTLVVVTGDHGEGLMQRGVARHGVHIYDEGVRVPLIMRLPGVIPPALVIESPIPSVDLLPTIMELITGSAPMDERMQGVSFAAALRHGAELMEERPVFLTRRHYQPGNIDGVEVRGMRYAVRLGKWKFFGDSDEGGPELYDLLNDPGEQQNLVASAPREAAALRERLTRWRRENNSENVARVELSEGDSERLKALGYVE